MAHKRSTGGAATSKRGTPKIRSGDRVRVLSGKDRGKSGRVLRVEPSKERLYVEGLNMNKLHTRPRQLRDASQLGGGRASVAGGVIQREGPIHISNVMLLDPKGGQPTRIRIERDGERRSRVAKRSGALID
jgi:large subunit ribosomal protein L24